MAIMEQLKKLKYADRLYAHLKSDINLNPQQQDYLRSLKKDGFCIIPNAIPPEQVESISKRIEERLSSFDFELPCFGQNLVDQNNEVHRELIEKKFSGSPAQYKAKGVAFDLEHVQGKSYPEVLSDFKPSVVKQYIAQDSLEDFNLWLNPFILQIVESYMGLRPYLREAYIRRNYPSQYMVMNHNWHRDRNEKDFILKAFFFFNDCNEENGPHEYVLGSHKLGGFYERPYFSEEEINNFCQANRLQTIKSIVKKGTVIIEDTKGLHRACLPKVGYRDLGFAVFSPLSFNKVGHSKYYKVNPSIVNALSSYQNSFIPKGSIQSGENF